ncbi:MAG TPA: T9SS type A sorting domain-containing protein [Ignavibacteria bacterium]|nr:T9SS type A sorting domain-containing protein [Ignavibacteria bacterium]HMQ99682.1 T9SS type A sorting domain-containing protein [Ignavibacteria bacterium]
MKKLKFLIAAIVFTVVSVYAQTDATNESKFNRNSLKNVSPNEITNEMNNIPQVTIPQALLKNYNEAVDSRNSELKKTTSSEIEKYLTKAEFTGEPIDVEITKDLNPPFINDWYGSDIQITNTSVAYAGGYRQLDLKKGEDGWMYLAVNRRGVPGVNGQITVYRSSNGGAEWNTVASITSITGYFGSLTMLVESKNNNVPDSTRILVYSTLSANSNLDNAYLICSSFRRDGSAASYVTVANPSAGNRFVYPSACSDGMFWAELTFMHVIVREESNSGGYIAMHHFRSTSWGASHTVGTYSNNTYEDRYPAAAFSNEAGNDSVYIAVEREVSNNEREIRLFAATEVPSNNFSIRYITDAAPGTIYERPAITIQQRSALLPQRILVTCTKNDRAVYHYSTDGGALWNIDFGLGLASMPVDYTSCSSDSSAANGKDFISAFVDLNGDSVTVRHGELGNLGAPMYKKNGVASTGSLAPVSAIYNEGNNKYAAFSYAGLGPAGVYYNMESLVTGITPVSNEVPNAFNLEQNYPNPFNPVTNIKFAVAKTGLVTLKVYDISGREVAQLVNMELNAGTYNFDFNASHLSSGIYFYRLTSNNYTDTKKMVLVK